MPRAVFLVILNRLHRREQKHVADGGAIGQEHHQTVDAEAETACGRHTVFQRGDEVLVYAGVAIRLGGALGSYLALKALALIDRVVQLREGVAELGGVDEILKTLGEGGLARLALGKRAVLHGVIVNKGGLNEVFLYVSVKQLDKHRALGCIGGHLYALTLSPVMACNELRSATNTGSPPSVGVTVFLPLDLRLKIASKTCPFVFRQKDHLSVSFI